MSGWWDDVLDSEMWTKPLGRGARLLNYPVPDWRVRELRAMPYDEYLLTDEWQRARQEALEWAAWRCQRCGSLQKLHVHHRSYDRVGQEFPDDLEVLCARCHREEHGR